MIPRLSSLSLVLVCCAFQPAVCFASYPKSLASSTPSGSAFPRMAARRRAAPPPSGEEGVAAAAAPLAAAAPPAAAAAAVAPRGGPLGRLGGALRGGADAEDVSGRVVLLTAVAMLLASTDRTIFSVGIVPIQQQLGLSAMTVGTLQSAFLVGYALTNAPGGALADKIGGINVREETPPTVDDDDDVEYTRRVAARRRRPSRRAKRARRGHTRYHAISPRERTTAARISVMVSSSRSRSLSVRVVSVLLLLLLASSSSSRRVASIRFVSPLRYVWLFVLSSHLGRPFVSRGRWDDAGAARRARALVGRGLPAARRRAALEPGRRARARARAVRRGVGRRAARGDGGRVQVAARREARVGAREHLHVVQLWQLPRPAHGRPHPPTRLASL